MSELARYIVNIDYALNGKPRTQRPRAVMAHSAAEAEATALKNFMGCRNEHRVRVFRVYTV